jgi:hypothetical protein
MNSWRGSKGGGGGVVAAAVVCLPWLFHKALPPYPKVGTLPYTMTPVAFSRGAINIQAGRSCQHCKREKG